jgi:FkbM family methyltransferase
MNIKSAVYKSSMLIMRQVWRLVGGRRLQVFGQSVKVTSDTVFPTYRKFPLPKKQYGAEIVRYCDYVQMHALVCCLSKITSPCTIVEVGAHHGAYTVLLGRIAKKVKGRVIAIEPNPEAFKVLLRNITMNDLEETVTCVQTAVMNSHGVLNLSLKGRESHIRLINTIGTYPVQVTKLSDLLNAYGVKHVHLLKIDVEGAELRVLQGFPWDAVDLDHIYCELHPYAWKHFGYSGEDVYEFLKRRNYRCLDMYFEEHMLFNSDAYIGPCLLLSPKT